MSGRRPRSHYDNLQVARNASPEVIRAAWKSLTQRYHPDKQPPNKRAEAERIMKILNEAYEVLSDPEKRKQHDRWIDGATQPIPDPQSPPQRPSPKAADAPASGKIDFPDLPLSIQLKMRNRAAGQAAGQFRVSLTRVTWNYVYVVVLGAWFLYLFAQAIDSRWSDGDLQAYAFGTLVVAGLISHNVYKILRWRMSVLKENLILTPLYIIHTSLQDRIAYWPLWDLKDISVTHRHQNERYVNSETRMEYPSETVTVFIPRKKDTEEFLKHLQEFGRELRSALDRHDMKFFDQYDDFRNVKTKPAKGKQRLLNQMLAGYGIPVAVCALLFVGAYSTSAQNPFVPVDRNSANRSTTLQSNGRLAKTEAPRPSIPAFTEPPQPLPETGEEKSYTSMRPVAPLQIVTPTGGQHFFVKVESWATHQPIKTFFIHGGQTYEVLVPLGAYRLKYASGEIWYGEKYLFGPNTIYSEADKEFDFNREKDGYSGYTIELILQRNGNLHSQTISAGQW